MTKISELSSGSVATFRAFISNMEEKLTKSNKPYVSITFKDDTGEISSNLWDERISNIRFSVKDICEIEGSISSYNGKNQVKISRMDKVEGDLSDFFRQPTQDIAKMLKALKVGYIASMDNKFIRDFVNHLIGHKDFIKAPAARGVHHPWIGGLLEHILGLCRMANKLYFEHYKHYFPALDMDKVYFGLIAHDWGKTVEYDFSSPDFKTTPRGALNHHIGIVIRELHEFYVHYKGDRDPELLTELEHIIYSHHGEIEWSSIMKPATQEALFVHLLDLMDARMMHMYEMKNTEGDIVGFTKKSFYHGTAYLKKEEQGF